MTGAVGGRGTSEKNFSMTMCVYFNVSMSQRSATRDSSGPENNQRDEREGSKDLVKRLAKFRAFACIFASQFVPHTSRLVLSLFNTVPPHLLKYNGQRLNRGNHGLLVVLSKNWSKELIMNEVCRD